ncbi:glycoside hydrolase family 75 protein [Streptomyces sp. NPDC059256]|uniref:glycoside hydrolase family 75 protein n=1 Tax=Streptomyces sp. NPDC059256 TaxID=3346794 RepID=UPI00369BAC0A
MRSSTLLPALVAALSGAALLSSAALPAAAETVQRVVTPDAYGVREGTVGAAELLARTGSCTQISSGKYAKDAGGSKSVPVCGTDEAVFWTADLDIDCDGRATTRCNAQTDPWFLPDTAFHQSDGRPLSAEELPFIVVPSPSSTWRYTDFGIKGGSVVAVVHDGKVRYGVVGDTGPTGIIGEASYAMAESLGIDPDPATGGIGSGVTYILFKNSKVSPIESHSAAVTLGNSLAKEFVANG